MLHYFWTQTPGFIMGLVVAGVSGLYFANAELNQYREIIDRLQTKVPVRGPDGKFQPKAA